MKKKIGTLKRVATSKRAMRSALAAVLARYWEPTWMPMTPIIEIPRMYSIAASRGLRGRETVAACSCMKIKTPYCLYCWDQSSRM